MDDSLNMRLGDWFARGLRLSPGGRALFVEKQFHSYGDLAASAGSLAAMIRKVQAAGEPPLAGLYSARTFLSYAGILGILASGNAYVPINPHFPPERNLKILDKSGLKTLVVDPRHFKALELLLDLCDWRLRLIVPISGFAGLERWRERHDIICWDTGPGSWDGSIDFDSAGMDDAAYLLFTSGSTGEPKGVAITHRNASAYMARMLAIYQPVKDDRFSQMFDLTFDLSVHDIFISFASGACLYVVPEAALMMPAKFIREHELTMWFSVPSVIAFMKRLGTLKPNSFPRLRHSLFCGEALPLENAQLWQTAAPNSTVDNLYGPTEATIAFTSHRLAYHTPANCLNGLVPIGEPMAGLQACVVDASGNTCTAGEPGELLLSGDQLSPGYWRDLEKTNVAFIERPAGPAGMQRWYRTGDRAVYSNEVGFLFLGRLDAQVKLNGYRIELGDIESALRSVTGTALVAAFAWPFFPMEAKAIEVFVGSGELPEEQIIHGCRRLLPAYMVPAQVHFIDTFPLNSNGKVDRVQLSRILQDLHADER